MKYITKNVIIALVIGLVVGLALAPQAEYQTDTRYSQIKELDEKIFVKYQSGLGEASGMIDCLADNDFDCLDEKTNNVNKLTQELEVLFNERNKLDGRY